LHGDLPPLFLKYIDKSGSFVFGFVLNEEKIKKKLFSLFQVLAIINAEEDVLDDKVSILSIYVHFGKMFRTCGFRTLYIYLIVHNAPKRH
jgi:hypothetical protein